MNALFAGLALLLGLQDEAALRDAFAKEFKDKKPEKRIEAVKKLSAVTEEKSVALLVTALKDPSVEVKKAACESLAGATDGAGAAAKPLAAVLVDKKNEPALRLAAAKALAKETVKADAIDAMIQAITIEESEKQLYAFGADCTKVLNETAGQDFGLTKETPAKWKSWWKDNQPKILKEDQEKIAAYKKSAKGK